MSAGRDVAVLCSRLERGVGERTLTLQTSPGSLLNNGSCYGAPHTLHARITQTESNVRTSRVGLGREAGGEGLGGQSCLLAGVIPLGLLAPPELWRLQGPRNIPT